MVLTASLGVWQLSRGAQKIARSDAMRERMAMPPLAALPALGEPNTAALHHRLVTVQGQWLHAHTVFLDNRQIVVQGKARVGFDVVTPLKLADGTAVVVQRGWVPRDFVDRSRLPPIPAPDGTVTVSGRYASTPPRLYEFKAHEDTLAKVRQNLDIDIYAREIGFALRPGSLVQVDGAPAAKPPASGTSAVPDLQRVWTLPDSGVARHHGYAFQWFALSALIGGLWLWFQVIQPRRKRGRDSAEQR
jgi:surfeit locus 1 family protein